MKLIKFVYSSFALALATKIVIMCAQAYVVHGAGILVALVPMGTLFIGALAHPFTWRA